MGTWPPPPQIIKLCFFSSDYFSYLHSVTPRAITFRIAFYAVKLGGAHPRKNQKKKQKSLKTSFQIFRMLAKTDAGKPKKTQFPKKTVSISNFGQNHCQKRNKKKPKKKPKKANANFRFWCSDWFFWVSTPKLAYDNLCPLFESTQRKLLSHLG